MKNDPKKMNFIHHEEPRFKVFKIIIYLMTGVFFIFSLLNYFIDNKILAALEFLFFLLNIISIANFKKIVKSTYIELFSTIYSVIILSLLMYALLDIHISNLSYFWVFSIPFVAYMINGIRKGFIITAIFTTISIVVYFLKTNNISHPFSIYQLVNVAIGVATFWTLTHVYEKRVLQYTKALFEQTTIDPLTSLKNRTRMYLSYKEFHGNMSIILVDIDLLKNINEAYGHLAGDVSLITIANIIKDNTPKNACAFRIGGDEFALLLPNIKSDEALTIAKAIYKDSHDCQTMFKGNCLDVSISLSVSSIYSDSHNLDELLKAADILLEKAKSSTNDKIAIL